MVHAHGYDDREYSFHDHGGRVHDDRHDGVHNSYGHGDRGHDENVFYCLNLMIYLEMSWQGFLVKLNGIRIFAPLPYERVLQ